MRETLTIAAAVLLAALVLALAVPPFVDWSTWSGALSAQLGKTLDARVNLGGPISVRLLPSPRFEVGALELARPGVSLDADSAELEMALVPLLRGNVSIASARLSRPRIIVDLRRETAAAEAREPIPALGIGIDRIALRDASLTILTDTGTRTLDRIDATASAEGGAGPFKAEGFMRRDQRLVPFRVATGALAQGRLAIKAESDPLPGLPRGEANGTLVWDGGTPRFEGIVTLSGEIIGAARGVGALPWRARVEGRAGLDGAEDTAVELRLGDESAKVIATGTGAVARDGGVTLDLASERPDFDRFRAAYDPASIRTAMAASGYDRPLRLRWHAESAVLGGEVVSGARTDVSRASGQTENTTLDMSLAVTRDGLLSFRGTVGAQGQANGDMVMRSGDAPALARWFGAVAPGAPAIAPPFARVDVAGRIAMDGARVDLTDMRAVFDRSTITGRASFTSAQDGRVSRLEAALASPALDLDALPDFAEVRSTARGVDLAVSVEARAIRVARMGQAQVEAGRISLAVNRNGDDLTLERLTLENIGGASLRASARVGPRAVHVEASLDARQLGDLASLLRRIAPGAWSDAIATRAGPLAPAALTLQLDAEGDSAGDGMTPTRVALAGKFAETSVRATLSPRTNNVAGTFTLEASDAAPLLRQFGVPVIPLRGQGSGRIEARLSGQPGAPLATSATANVAGATAQFDGALRLDADAPGATGALHIDARDLGPLLRIVAAPVDAFAGWPIDLRMQIDARSGALSMKAIAGRVAETTVSGDLKKPFATPLWGALHLGRLDVRALGAVLLGPTPPIAAGQTFSALKFGPQPNDPPAAAIDLRVDRLALPGGVEGSDATGRLTLGPGMIEATDVSVGLAGGKLSGGMTLRRREDTASLAGNVIADSVRLALPWMTGTVSGRAALSGAGTSMAGLAATLAGKGTIRVERGTLARADPAAPLRVATAVDAERIALEPAAIDAAVAAAFDTASQTLPAFEQPVAIEAGAAGIGPFDLSIGPGDATLAVRYDLAKDRVELREALRPVPPPDWTGASPRVELAIAGPTSAPVRSIDTTALIATLATHGLEREEVRRDAIDADRRERAFFNRRLRTERAGEVARRAEQVRLDTERREADAAREELQRREAARQREAERLLRERQRIERQQQMPAGSAAPLDLQPPAAFMPTPGRTPAIIVPDPGTAGRY